MLDVGWTEERDEAERSEATDEAPLLRSGACPIYESDLIRSIRPFARSLKREEDDDGRRMNYRFV